VGASDGVIETPPIDEPATNASAARQMRHPGRGRRSAVPAVVALLLLITGALAAGRGSALGPATARAADAPVRILTGPADSLDPAAQGDIESAAISAQLFESLTAIDATLQTRPALAASWDFANGGRSITFHLRPDLTFSDGSPLTGDDVVRSWFRVIDPKGPSPLLSLMGDVDGALAYAHGETRDRGSVGLTANGRDVTVRLDRPARDFPTIVASPTFGIVPPGIDASPSAIEPGRGFVASGGYTVAASDAGTTTLAANDHYWAGKPAIETVKLVHDIGGRSSVAAFEAGDLDVADVSPFDATWLGYDDTLGPQLRRSNGLSVQYYGFDTTRPPFSDVRVRQAFTRAVDWRRLVSLASTDTAIPATGMVPPGIPGRSSTDFLPAYDPAGARGLLAAAGYAGGSGFPTTVLLGGGPSDAAFAAEVKQELGVTIEIEYEGDDLFDRLSQAPPQIFTMGWVADFPGPNDFLGILLGSGSSNNYGQWSSAPFDRAIGDALSATDPTAARAAFDRAESIVRDDVPAIPLTYDVDWSLAKTGLLGAYSNGLGIIRMPGLAWAP
jgi:oligopeptide transport system substrate-binding protein